ncbi:MAG: hypothetical protein MUF48_00280 [Pirellulaceae bacterium]|jgi:hypothetical protein|nr:hypothetical protein [Pirellulaceae bacterium]
MNAKSWVLSAVWCWLLASVLGSPARAQFTPLLQRVPESANMIFLLNAEKIFDSEVGKREGWRTNFAKAIEAGLMHIPADTQQYVLAGEQDFTTMQPVWQVAALQVPNKRDLPVIAKRLEGKQDTVASHPAVVLPSGDYVVVCGDTTVAALVPAARQAVVRWITATEKATPRFSDYITEAVGYAEKSGTELILAADLSDVLDPDDVRARFEGASFGADQTVNLDELAAVMASIQGVMLGVTFGEKPYGSIKVDFGRDAAVLDGIARQLMLDAIAQRGAMIDDLIEQYFQDLRDKEPQKIAQYGIWFEKYARKIDNLPLVNVDDEMLTYGAYVSQQLRNAAAAIQGIGIRSRVRQVEAAQATGDAVPGYYGSAYNGGYAYGGNYYYGGPGRSGNYLQEGLRQQQMARTQVKVQEKAAGTTAARAIVRDIETATATVRREMTKKYNIEF